MPFQAGSIVSKLVLDKSKFSASVKDVAKDQKTLGGAIQKNSASFKKAGMAMTVAGGAIVASMGLMIKKYVSAGDQIHKMALRTGFATETLSELKYAAEISGSNIESLEKGVKKMSKTIVDASTGLETYVRSFDRIGLSVDELMELSPEEQFLKIAEAIAAMESPTLRAATAQEIFGRAGTELLPLFAEGVDGMEALRKKAHELGIVFDQEAAEKAARLADAQTTLKTALQGVTISIAESLAPALSKLAEDLSDTVAKVGDWIKEHPKLTSIITKATLGIGALMMVLGPLVMMLPGLIAALPAIAMGIHAILGPLGLVTAAAVVAYNVINNLIDAQKSLADAEMTAIMSETEHYKQLTEIGRAAGLTAKEIRGLTEKYDGNYAALGMAIRKGKEGVELQKAQVEYGKKHKEAIDEQKKSLNKLSPALDDVGKAMTNVAIPTKTWIDYIKSIGLQTVKEKGDRIEELEGYVNELSKAYAAGKISLEDYTKALKAATDEIEDLSTAITNTAIPAANDMSGVFEQAADDMESEFYDAGEGIKGSAEDTEKAVEKTWDELHPYWSNLCTDLGTSFGNFTGSILSTGSDMKDALAGLWSDIKSSWIGMAVDMVADWGTNFIKKILSSITSDLVPGIAAKCVEVKAASAACGVNAGTAAGGSLTSSFASALGVVAIEAAVFAAFIGAVSLLDKLFPKHVKTMAELAAIEAKKAFDKAAKEYALPGEWGKEGIIAEPGEAGGGQPPAEPGGNYKTGGLVPKTGLAIVHQGEFVIPKISVPEMNIPEMRSPGISKKININISLQPVFQFNNQVDPNFTRKHVQNEILPVLMTLLETGARKTRMKEIMRVA